MASWTTIDAVVGEVPGFARGGVISDTQIATWIVTVSQSVAGALLRRGLPLDEAEWPAAGQSGMPTGSSTLEMITRLGAAATLAAAVAAQFTAGEFHLAKVLQRRYEDELKALRAGDYDKLFRAAAATIETGGQLAVGDQTDPDTGEDTTAFRKEDVF